MAAGLFWKRISRIDEGTYELSRLLGILRKLKFYPSCLVCQVRILHCFTKPLGIVLTAQMEKPRCVLRPGAVFVGCDRIFRSRFDALIRHEGPDSSRIPAWAAFV